MQAPFRAQLEAWQGLCSPTTWKWGCSGTLHSPLGPFWLLPMDLLMLQGHNFFGNRLAVGEREVRGPPSTLKTPARTQTMPGFGRVRLFPAGRLAPGRCLSHPSWGQEWKGWAFPANAARVFPA